MGKYKHLLKNMSILTLGSLGTRILSFFLVPLYTNALSAAEYGIYDIIHSTILLLLPILTLNLSEGLLRFSIDNCYDREKLLFITIKYFLIGLSILLVFLIINKSVRCVGFISDYTIEFLLLYISNALVNIVTSYARGMDRIKEVAVAGILGTVVNFSLNIVFLLFMKLGLLGFFYAGIIGAFFQIVYMLISTKMVIKFGVGVHDSVVEKAMMQYSIPLILNSIAWWVNAVSDRYIVTYYRGVEENGVYSVAYKIPSILTMIGTIFNQAWIISAVKEFDEADSDGFFTNVYEIYGGIMVFACSLLMVFNKLIAWIFFKKSFFSAWVYAPFLLFSVLFGSLSGYLGGIINARQKTRITAITVIAGAGINLALNMVLVNYIGALGAAIATCVSYFVVWGFRLIAARRFIKLKVSIFRDLVVYLILLVQAMAYVFIKNTFCLWVAEIIAFIFIVVIHILMWEKYKHKIRSRSIDG